MLIVDDNEEMLNFLSSSLADKYSILTAEDGIEALNKTQRKRSDTHCKRLDDATHGRSGILQSNKD